MTEQGPLQRPVPFDRRHILRSRMRTWCGQFVAEGFGGAERAAELAEIAVDLGFPSVAPKVILPDDHWASWSVLQAGCSPCLDTLEAAGNKASGRECAELRSRQAGDFAYDGRYGSEDCGCFRNEAGDIRCHQCGELVNETCWRCKAPRGRGSCPGAPPPWPVLLEAGVPVRRCRHEGGTDPCDYQMCLLIYGDAFLPTDGDGRVVLGRPSTPVEEPVDGPDVPLRVPDTPAGAESPAMDFARRLREERQAEHDALQAGAPAGMVALRLVPVEVFGTDSCCEHGPSPQLNGIECDSIGYGLSDAVPAWSDCNRAIGQVYRVDDLPGRMDPDPGEPPSTVVIYVPAESVEWFKLKWGDAKREAKEPLPAEPPLPPGVQAGFDQMMAEVRDEFTAKVLHSDGHTHLRVFGLAPKVGGMHSVVCSVGRSPDATDDAGAVTCPECRGILAAMTSTPAEPEATEPADDDTAESGDSAE